MCLRGCVCVGGSHTELAASILNKSSPSLSGSHRQVTGAGIEYYFYSIDSAFFSYNIPNDSIAANLQLKSAAPA